MYKRQDESGQYVIRENVVGEEADYVAKANQTEDVRLLASQINQQLKEALESDALLAGVYKKLQNGAVVRATEESRDSEVSIITDGTGGESESAGEGQGSETGVSGEGQDSESGSAGADQDQSSETSDSAGDSSAAQDNVQGTEESSSASEEIGRAHV